MQNPLKRKRPCCVAKCENRHSKRHRFPKNEPEIFKQWISNTQPVNHHELSQEQIYNKFYVCDNHFQQECFVPGTHRGLRRDAVPTLFIKATNPNRNSIDPIKLEAYKKY
ncbi:hypothetical protein NQ315_006032 [Exocentrus adspersus]|uniref:THAP-type domain-containing protein n=1 Tax=Exocentrus adspersus TaxID=1586481 RepID=A0AAV8VAG7_9CUCU|nr:hypothetical protein NQ315_006032 [Exocentrus adspersus]